MTLSLCFAYWFGNPSINPKLAMTIVGFASIAILGIARLTRWTYGALQEMARIRTQAESARLLLQDYEHRGVGWLWSVDSENRVVYTTSRMTATLGRSTSQCTGHWPVASLGGTRGLGRSLPAHR